MFSLLRMNISALVVAITLPIIIVSISVGYFILDRSLYEKSEILRHDAFIISQLISDVAQFDSQYSKEPAFDNDAFKATLAQVQSSLNASGINGLSFEYLVGTRIDEEIVFEAFSMEQPPSVPWDEKALAVPMRKAIMGEAGVIIDGDYIGKKVFAAYHPIPHTPWGLVIKQPYDIHILPFKQAILINVIITLLLIIFIYKVLRFYQHRTDTLLKNSETRFQQLIESGDNWVWEVDKEGVYTYSSPQVWTLLGYRPDEIVGKTPFEFMDEQEAQRLSAIFAEAVADRTKITDLVNINRHKNGDEVYLLTGGSPFFNEKGELFGYRGMDKDITQSILDKKQLEEHKRRLEASEKRLQKLFDLQKNIVILSDGEDISMANQAMYTFFGVERLDDFTEHYTSISERFIETEGYFDVKKVPEGSTWVEAILPLFGDKRVVVMYDADNRSHIFNVSLSKFDEDLYIISFTDISATMTEKIALSRKATHDQLTGLLNREFLHANYQNILENIGVGKALGLLIFDIDHFKKINDTYGHNTGDEVLKEVAEIVATSIRKEDFLIRWGGEEFIVLAETASARSLSRVAQHLRQKIEHHDFPIVENLTCSFGTTIHIEDEDVTKTIERADKALYLAKNSGRNRVEAL